MKLIYTVIDIVSYQTVKDVLKKQFHLSDRLITKLKRKQGLYKNKKTALINDILKKNDQVTVNLDFEEDNENIVPTKMDLSIVYEDDAFLLLDKPAGIAIHPSMLHYDSSLSNGVRFYFDSIGLKKKIRPVTRLDKDTSGLVIFAKNEYVQECFIRQMQNQMFRKKYVAVLDGIPPQMQGVICAPIARKKDSIIQRCVEKNGDFSITQYQVLKKSNSYCYVEFLLETGRTHQIRVHTEYLHCPILGDTLYGKPSQWISRQALHCYFLQFIHPLTQKSLCFHSKLPKDIQMVYEQLFK